MLSIPTNLMGKPCARFSHNLQTIRSKLRQFRRRHISRARVYKYPSVLLCACKRPITDTITTAITSVRWLPSRLITTASIVPLLLPPRLIRFSREAPRKRAIANAAREHVDIPLADYYGETVRLSARCVPRIASTRQSQQSRSNLARSTRPRSCVGF